MNAAELLERTAEVITERGHCKGRLQDERGRVCLIGGVHVAADTLDSPNQDVRTEALDALRAYLGLQFIYDLPAWNNAPGREPHEVTDTCRHVAKVLRGG